MKVPFLKLIVRKIRQSIAIVEEGDTCTHTGGLAVGKYVIWKGTLCKVTTAIQNGATISASSLSVVDDGIANELNNKLIRVNEIKYGVGTSLSANSDVTFDIDISKTGYVPIEIELVSTNYGGVFPLGYYIHSSSVAKVTLYNSLSQAITTYPTIKVMYVKE